MNKRKTGLLYIKILCALCSGSVTNQATAKANDKQELADAQQKAAEAAKKVVAKVGNIKITYGEVMQVVIMKIQRTGKMVSDPKALQSMFQEALNELIQTKAYYLKHKDELFQNQEFKSRVFMAATLIARDLKLEKQSQQITQQQTEEGYNKLLADAPIPLQYKIRVSVAESAQKADRILKAIESGAPFVKIAQESTKSHEFPNGNVTDKQTGSQFVTLFNAPLPGQVKAALQPYNKANQSNILIKQPIVVQDQSGNASYWVVQIDQIKQGSKKDFPPFDPSMANQINRVIAAKAQSEEMKEAVKSINVQVMESLGHKA